MILAVIGSDQVPHSRREPGVEDREQRAGHVLEQQNDHERYGYHDLQPFGSALQMPRAPGWQSPPPPAPEDAPAPWAAFGWPEYLSAQADAPAEPPTCGAPVLTPGAHAVLGAETHQIGSRHVQRGLARGVGAAAARPDEDRQGVRPGRRACR